MEYGDLVTVYERLAATQSDRELTAIVAGALADADAAHLPRLVTLLQGDPFATWQPQELGLSSNLTREAIAQATGVDEDAIEDRWRETGDLGSAAAWAVANATQQTLVSNTLTVESVHETLREIPAYEGEGSQGRRIDAVAGLLADADPEAARYLVRTVLGHLRLGVGEGTLRDAIAEAFLTEAGPPTVEDPGSGDEPDLYASEDAVAAVERAFQVTTDYRLVAETARDAGREGLAALDVEVGRPLRVMLAQKAPDATDALRTVAEQAGVEPPDGTAADDLSADHLADRDVPALLEYKLDGFRVQVHKDGDDVTVFTRRLEDVTHQFPDVVAHVHAIDAERTIVEGEVLALDPDTGEPLPFQALSRRIKRKYDVQRMTEEIPVATSLFDLLSLEGETYLDRPLRERLAALEGILDPVPDAFERVPSRRTSDPAAADSFYREAVDAGQEGLMVKNLEATYQPGSRVGYMMKVKPTMEPLDLTVVRARWSEGRRSDNLGRLYLGCRDPETGDFREVGRLSTGFTDVELAEMTDRLEPHIQAQDGREVALEPSEVVAVAYEEIQQSPEYDSGYALRFPRFEGFRDDLSLADVDTVRRVERLYEDQ